LKKNNGGRGEMSKEIGKRNELIAEYFCKGQERIL